MAEVAVRKRLLSSQVVVHLDAMSTGNNTRGLGDNGAILATTSTRGATLNVGSVCDLRGVVVLVLEGVIVDHVRCPRVPLPHKLPITAHVVVHLSQVLRYQLVATVLGSLGLG